MPKASKRKDLRKEYEENISQKTKKILMEEDEDDDDAPVEITSSKKAEILEAIEKERKLAESKKQKQEKKIQKQKKRKEREEEKQEKDKPKEQEEETSDKEEAKQEEELSESNEPTKKKKKKKQQAFDPSLLEQLVEEENEIKTRTEASTKLKKKREETKIETLSIAPTKVKHKKFEKLSLEVSLQKQVVDPIHYKTKVDSKITNWLDTHFFRIPKRVSYNQFRMEKKEDVGPSKDFLLAGHIAKEFTNPYYHC
ncbi:hypothetical protein ABK040_011478 [Willaertia magna]